MARLVRICAVAFPFLLPATEVRAQPPEFQRPALRYLFDAPNRSVRVVNGVPGASWMGEAVLTEVSAAAISPDGRSALCRRQDRLLWLDLSGAGAAATAAVEGAAGDVDLISWSADSSRAVIASVRRKAAQIVSHSDGIPRADAEIDLSGLEGEITSLAVLPGARRVLAGLRSDDDGGLYVVDAAAGTVRLGTVRDPAPGLFARGGELLYIADRGAGEVLVLRELEGVPLVERMAPAAEGGLAAAAPGEGGRLFVAACARPVLEVYQLPEMSRREEIELDVRATTMEPLGGTTLLQLNRRTQTADAVLLLDTATGAVSLIPGGEGGTAR